MVKRVFYSYSLSKNLFILRCIIFIHRNKINTFQILVMLENESRSNNKNIKNVDPVIGRFCGGVFIFFAINWLFKLRACMFVMFTNMKVRENNDRTHLQFLGL